MGRNKLHLQSIMDHHAILQVLTTILRGVPDGHTTLTEARNLRWGLAKLSEISAAIRSNVPVYTQQPPPSKTYEGNTPEARQAGFPAPRPITNAQRQAASYVRYLQQQTSEFNPAKNRPGERGSLKAYANLPPAPVPPPHYVAATT